MSNTHNDVAHNWYNRTGRCTNGHNMFYVGDTIYSYGRHFPIARHVQDKHGNWQVLLTTDSYSVSTAKHITITKRATGFNYFSVPNVLAESELEHQSNFENYVARMHMCFEKAKRARIHFDTHIEAAKNLHDEAKRYAEAFEIGHDIPLCEEHIKMIANAEKIAEERRARQIRQARLRDEQAKKDILRWQSGEINTAPHTSYPHLRIHKDRVQTSWGAQVTIEQALRLYAYWRIAKKSGKVLDAKEYANNQHYIFNGFPLRKITPDGTIEIGCHVILNEHVEEIAPYLDAIRKDNS